MTRSEWFEENPDVEIFRDPDYAEALIGYTHDGCPVYDLDKMIEILAAEYAQDPECEDPVTDAIEWIEYNTIRTAPYMNHPPVFLNMFEQEEGENK